MINERPRSLEKVKEIVTISDDQIEGELKQIASNLEEPDEHNVLNAFERRENEAYSDDKRVTIKDSTPFNKHFKSVYDKVLKQLDRSNQNDTSLNENIYYCERFVNHLLDQFMPYCFIWASFVLNGSELEQTRWTNGCIEKYFATKKNIQKSFLNMLPSEYVNYNYNIRLGECLEFKKSLDKTTNQRRRHIPSNNLQQQQIQLSEEEIDLPMPSDLLETQEILETAPAQSQDIFQKKPQPSALIRIGKKNQFVGHF